MTDDGALPSWTAFGGTARGALHVQAGLPNQDAFAIGAPPRDGVLVAAVADGHGERRCVRADVGARLAVAAAVSEVGRFEDLSRQRVAANDAANRQDPPTREDAVRLVSVIVAAWQMSVRAHLATHPWQAHERAQLDVSADTTLAYGCTLLLAVVAGPALVLAQIGDGDILVVRDHGRTSRPVTQRIALVGGETLSLATGSAHDAAAVAVLPLEDDIRMVLLATDGYANSFATADWDSTIGRDYLQALTELGVARMADCLPQWAQASADAAGDDVTLLVAARA